MTQPRKILPFDSDYADKNVVEQRIGDKLYYPHSDQLPELHRALVLEFRTGLPGYIARVDRRGSDFDKLMLYTAVTMFCCHANANRPDQIRLHPHLDEQMVAGISICQREREIDREHGILNRFRFFTGTGSPADVFFNGKTLAFSGHAIDQFSDRVPSHPGAYLTDLLTTVYNGPAVVLICNSDPAFVFKYHDSVVVFPVRETDDEYVVPTCLSAVEVNALSRPRTPIGVVSSYSRNVKIPELWSWDFEAAMEKLIQIWRERRPVSPPKHEPATPHQWLKVAHEIRERLRAGGCGPETIFRFVGDIPGPCVARWFDKKHWQYWREGLTQKSPDNKL